MGCSSSVHLALSLQHNRWGWNIVRNFVWWRHPIFYRCISLTCVMITYLILGGMKSSAMTDVFQGILMFTILIIFVLGFFIHEDIGGFSEGGKSLWDNKPEKFVREGNFTWQIIFSYTILWPITVPMFLNFFLDFTLLKMIKPYELRLGYTQQ